MGIGKSSNSLEAKMDFGVTTTTSLPFEADNDITHLSGAILSHEFYLSPCRTG